MPDSSWRSSCRFAFVVLLSLLAGPLHAQTAPERATVNGYVRDAQTGETLIQATITIAGTTRGTTTNTSGFYTLSGLTPGEVTLRFSFIGYADQERTLDLAPGTLRLDVDLESTLLDAEGVTVEADQPIEEERAVGVTQVSIDLVERIPSAFENDLFRSIQLLPGVKSANDFSSKLYIRGGAPDQTLILLDNTTVYNPTHFFGFFSIFNTDAIKDVRLYKGGYPATYGGRLGSVIDIYNREGNRNEFDASLGIGLLASRVGLEGPVNIGGVRGSWLVAARRSTLEPVLAALRETDITGIPDSYYFYDVNARLALDLSTRDKLSISTYLGQDRVDVPIFDDARFILDYGNRTFSLGYTRILSDNVFVNTSATASQYFNFPVGEFAGTEFTRDNTATDFSLRADVEWLPSARFEAQVGVWGGHLDLLLEDTFDQQESFTSKIGSNYLQSYVQTVYRPFADWILTTGLRLSYHGSGEYVRLEPRAQLERTFGDRAVIQFAYGRYTQFLSLVSNESFSGFDVWVMTDTGLGPQSSDQVVLGLKTKPARGYALDVELYYRTMDNLFELIPFLQDATGLPYEDLFRVGDGYAYGLELLAEKQVGRITGLLSYTLATTRRRFPARGNYPGVNQDFDTGEFLFYPPKYDRLHDFTAVVEVGLGRKWTFTLAGVYQTGQAYTLPQGRYGLRGNPFGNTDLNGLYSA
ncbi:MAG: carboxypeptidase-like regulatory domain-containing protein, partial [Bacteroidota bacterium]